MKRIQVFLLAEFDEVKYRDLLSGELRNKITEDPDVKRIVESLAKLLEDWIEEKLTIEPGETRGEIRVAWRKATIGVRPHDDETNNPNTLVFETEIAL